ncbi:MAG: hypothetical protein IPQ07_38015 [Myxococcales bacterium]|nr:hypothetical protein [Myxococcales bacterium]
MTEARATLEYVPHARQEAFHRDPRPWRWFCAGYGTGKTTTTVFEALMLADVTHPGCTGIVAAPTYTLLFQSWFEVWKATVPRALWELKRDPLLGPHIIVKCQNGARSKIFLRSTSNPWSNEGINAAWLIFDEATRERDRAAFDVLVSRVRKGVVGRQLSVLVSGPPMTRRHWTSTEFGAGPGDGRVGTMLAWHGQQHAVVRARTRDNPYLPPDYEAQLRSRPGVTEAWARQWCDAEFGAMEGQIYAAFSRDVHVIPAASLKGRGWRRIVIGTDWGFTHPGVMLAVAQDGYGDLYVIREEVHRERSVIDAPGQWVDIARTLDRDLGPAGFSCDPSLPGNLAAIKKGVRARVYGADNNMAEGIRVVTALLEQAVDRERERRAGRPIKHVVPALYVSDACTHTIGEFEAYARKKLRDGSVSEEPTEEGDDAMDSLRYAAVALRRAA